MPKYEFTVDGVSVEAVFNRLGGPEGARRFLRGELQVCELKRPWKVDAAGVIHLSVTSNGLTGEQWIARLEGLGRRVDKYAKSVLRSSAFKPSKGVTTDIVVIPGSFWKTDAERTTSNIRTEGARRGWQQGVDLNPEVACLIREMFSDDELKNMGLWAIIVMHESILASDGLPCLLGARRDDDVSWLNAYGDCPGYQWIAGGGFAFGVPQS